MDFEQLLKSLAFWFDSLFAKLLGAETYAKLKIFIATAIDWIEVPGDGASKREVVITAALQFLGSINKTFTGLGPIQTWIIRAVLGIVLESVLSAMKQTGWSEQKAKSSGPKSVSPAVN